VHEQVPAVDLGGRPPGDAGVQERPVQRPAVRAAGGWHHQVEAVEVGQREVGASGQRVAAVDHQHLRVGGDQARLVVAGRRVVRDDREVGRAAGQRGDGRVAVGGEHLHSASAGGQPAHRIGDHPAQRAAAGGQGEGGAGVVQPAEEVVEPSAGLHAERREVLTGVRPQHLRFCRTRGDKRLHCVELGLTHFVDDHPEVHAAIRGTVDHQYFFGPQRRPVPGWAHHAPTWPDALRQIRGTLARRDAHDGVAG